MILSQSSQLDTLTCCQAEMGTGESDMPLYGSVSHAEALDPHMCTRTWVGCWQGFSQVRSHAEAQPKLTCPRDHQEHESWWLCGQVKSFSRFFDKTPVWG